MRIVRIIICLLLLVGLVRGQEDKQGPFLETLIEAKIPVANKNLFFIVDTSGSMNGEKVMKAIATVIELCSAPVDDFQVAAISFGTESRLWEGTEDIDPRTKKDVTLPGWSLMPSQDNLKSLEKWLEENKEGTGTNVIPAILKAFEESMNIKDISIVIISDCDFDSGQSNGAIISTIQEQQSLRQKAGMPPVSLGIFGIEMPDTPGYGERPSIKVLAKREFICIAELGVYNFTFSPPESEENSPIIPFANPH